MQTTLLTFAITLILALIAALVGPHFVNWNDYRDTFESQASQLTGLDVRIAGPIEARLLPTPSVTLRQTVITRPGETGALQARRVDIEFALSSLVRGEWKAADVRVDGAELSITVDRDGRVDWPAPAGRFDPSAISIERIDIRDGRILLADAKSGASAVLDRFAFEGELRTLAGPVKGQGTFSLDGQQYPYRLSATRTGEASGVRVRLTLEPTDLPLTVEADTLVNLEDGLPRFEGSLALARPVVRAAAESDKTLIDPWRLTSRVRGDSREATFEQIEFQYGPEDRALKLRGTAQLAFGEAPKLDAILAATQIDLDRLLALPDDQRGKPAVALRALADQFAGRYRLPIPVEVGLSADTLTLAGATLQRVSAELYSAPDGWMLKLLELRAPGITQAQFAGQIGLIDNQVSIAGRLRVDSKDPRTLLGWLTEQSDPKVVALSNHLLIDGEVKLNNDMLEIDRLRAEFERVRVDGRIAYVWGNADRPPRIEAALRAPELDVDRTRDLFKRLTAGTRFAWPREGEVRAEIGRAVWSGIEATAADINMRFDAQGLTIEQMTVADLGGAALSVKGQIDRRHATPSGAISIDVDAKRIEEIAALVEVLSPESAEHLRRNAARVSPARLRATLAVAALGGAENRTTATVKIDGAAGPTQIATTVSLIGAPDDIVTLDTASWARAAMQAQGKLTSESGVALTSLIGLDRTFAVGSGRAALTFDVKGPLDGRLSAQAEIAAAGLQASVRGTLRPFGREGATAGGDLSVSKAELIVPNIVGRTRQTLPLAITARAVFADNELQISDIAGSVAREKVGGHLRVRLGDLVGINGDLRFASLTLPAAIAVAVGAPPGEGRDWSPEPFDGGLIGSINGKLALRADAVAVTPALTAQNLRTVLRFEADQVSLDDIKASFADGQMSGGMVLQRGADGLTAQGHLRFAGADVARLFRGSGLSGRLTLDLDIAGSGRSPIALVSAWRGGGTFTLQDGKVERLNPAAFAVVMKAVERGLAIDAERVVGSMTKALASGPLALPLAQGEVSLAAGQLRLVNTVVKAQGADMALRGTLALADLSLESEVTLSGPSNESVLKGARPQVTLTMRGPLNAPSRTLDVASFSNWLALRTIEEQARRIEALESGRERPAPPPASPPAQLQSEPADPVSHKPPAEQIPAAAPAKPEPKPAPVKLPAQAATQQGETSAPNAVQPKKPTQMAPKVSAPVDIRPGAAARAQQAPEATAKPAPAPKPPRTRSWLENLLGP